jgi:hypothetical protein
MKDQKSWNFYLVIGQTPPLANVAPITAKVSQFTSIEQHFGKTYEVKINIVID